MLGNGARDAIADGLGEGDGEGDDVGDGVAGATDGLGVGDGDPSTTCIAGVGAVTSAAPPHPTTRMARSESASVTRRVTALRTRPDKRHPDLVQ